VFATLISKLKAPASADRPRRTVFIIVLHLRLQKLTCNII
jgi:hypothetical protein